MISDERIVLYYQHCVLLELSSNASLATHHTPDRAVETDRMVSEGQILLKERSAASTAAMFGTRIAAEAEVEANGCLHKSSPSHAASEGKVDRPGNGARMLPSDMDGTFSVIPGLPNAFVVSAQPCWFHFVGSTLLVFLPKNLMRDTSVLRDAKDAFKKAFRSSDFARLATAETF